MENRLEIAVDFSVAICCVVVAMKKVLGGRVDERELEKLFMKVDTNCDGTVDWDEFLSYMLLEYLEKDLIKVYYFKYALLYITDSNAIYFSHPICH